MARPPRDQWYVVHVLSGQEKKVQENLIRRIKTEEMGDYVYEVLLPTERVRRSSGERRPRRRENFSPAT